VHGRTRGQFYRGSADWRAIAEVKAALAVPVIGSGDVLSSEDARSMLERTGVDAVMVARGAQGYPWIFREARALIDLGESVPGPGDQERVAVAREHLRALVERFGEEGARRMRKHVSWYITGMPSASVVRERAYVAAGSRELDALLADYADYLREREARRTA
jgi:tRNA-dihydrouridine synthase B